MPKQVTGIISNPTRAKANPIIKNGTEKKVQKWDKSPAGLTKLIKSANHQTPPTLGRTGASKGITVDARNGHQPKMRQPTEEKETKESNKRLLETQDSEVIQPRKIDFASEMKEKPLVPENAHEPMDAAVTGALEYQTMVMTVDNPGS
ncbi:unnamed protein product [Linum trigynum]|uniref:Uncharacterized protein n=1 Tax=Linum trigynum TaxID=586398 RepID=A0AAV2F6T0_9ROSI